MHKLGILNILKIFSIKISELHKFEPLSANLKTRFPVLTWKMPVKSLWNSSKIKLNIWRWCISIPINSCVRKFTSSISAKYNLIRITRICKKKSAHCARNFFFHWLTSFIEYEYICSKTFRTQWPKRKSAPLRMIVVHKPYNIKLMRYVF